MIKHYFKIAFRNLSKYRIQTIISIIGLSIGFVCFALSMLWLQYERSFDNFHSKADRIYTVQYINKDREMGVSQIVSYPLAEYLKSNFPEIEEAACTRLGYITIEMNGRPKRFKTLSIDSSFCRIFDLSDKHLSFPHYISFNDGSSTRPSAVPVAITNRAAREIFGNEDPIGEEIKGFFPGSNSFRIEKMIEAWTKNTNLEFDFLEPITTDDNFFVQMYSMYILLKPDVDVKALSNKLENIESDKFTEKIKITPLTSYKLEFASGNVKYGYIRLFALSGLLVACCALFNYLILFINRIKMRKREFALRKTNGASNRGILALLYTEIFTILLSTLILGTFIIYLILPQFKEITRIELPDSNIYIYLLIYTIILIIGIIVLSIVPVYYFQRQTIRSSLQNNTTGIKNLFYKICILIQLIISIGFIFCTVILMKQINHLNQLDLGFDRKNIALVNLKWQRKSLLPYVDKVKQIPAITDVLLYRSQATLYVGASQSYNLKSWEGKSDDKEVNFQVMDITSHYIDFFNIRILQGRNFNPEILDKSEMIINESAAKALGWKEPIGKIVTIPYIGDKKIIGVIKDFHYEHPNMPVKPIFFYHTNEFTSFVYKYEEGKKKETEEAITNIILKDYPKDEVRFTYMEDMYQDFFKSENALLRLLIVTTIVCIIISIFGVYSMVTLICARRRKEIAIRKVNGAGVLTILYNLLKEYLTLLVIASVIAFPVGYIIMSAWIESYTMQTPINWWIYLIIFLGTVLVISMAVFSQVWKASVSNPAEVLKSE